MRRRSRGSSSPRVPSPPQIAASSLSGGRFWREIAGIENSVRTLTSGPNVVAAGTVSQVAQLPVIYLAAGRGSRLGDLTAEIPKALVRAGHRPLADRAFEYLRDAGFERIIVVAGHQAELFANYDVETVFNDRW